MPGDEALSFRSLPRWAAFLCGYLAGLFPFLALAQTAVPGAANLIRLIPQGLQGSAAALTGLLAGALALILRSRDALSARALRKAFLGGSAGLVLGLALLVAFQQSFVRRLELDGGSKIVSIVVAPPRLPGCLCPPTMSDEDCLHQSVAPEARDKCWDRSRVSRNELAWSAAYLLFVGGALSGIGYLSLPRMSAAAAALSRAPAARRIFLSYSSLDGEFVGRLERDLRDRGIAVWRDQGELETGDLLPTAIADAIAGSSWFGIVLSPDAVASRWVRLELNMAIALEVETGTVQILPLLYRPCEIPTALLGRKRADFTARYEDGLPALLATLSA